MWLIHLADLHSGAESGSRLNRFMAFPNENANTEARKLPGGKSDAYTFRSREFPGYAREISNHFSRRPGRAAGSSDRAQTHRQRFLIERDRYRSDVTRGLAVEPTTVRNFYSITILVGNAFERQRWTILTKFGRYKQRERELNIQRSNFALFITDQIPLIFIDLYAIWFEHFTRKSRSEV